MGLANIHVITEDRSSGAQVIDGSLKFVSGSNHHLVRTPSASNRRTFTWSSWHKRTELGDDIHTIFNAAPSSHSSSPAVSYLVFEDHDTLRFYNYWSSAERGDLKTTALFRDGSAWYHVVLAVDTTIASPSSDRTKLYVNGERITSFANENYPAQDLELYINANVEHKIGEESVRDRYEYAGYMSECNFVDGQQLDPSYFGFTEPLTNTWRPKKYTGTYGTNGFYLPMNNQNDFEIDKSGNGNDWTKGNFSGTANDPDVFPDSPSGITYSTASSSGITTVSQRKPSNYCTLNLLDRGTSYAPTLSDGNLKAACPNNTQNPARGTLAATSGKWYFEGTCTARQYNPGIGVMSAGASLGTGDNFRSLWGTQAAAWYSFTGGTNNIYSNGSSSSYDTAFATNDVLMIAYDIDAGKIWFGKNGTWNDNGDPAAGTNHAATFTNSNSITPFIDGSYSSSPGDSWALNFGQKPFKYVPPEGFKVLCLANLPKPTSPAAVRPDRYVGIVTYTGNATAREINLDFAPDIVWIKKRNGSESHALGNRMIGADAFLSSNLTDNENTASGCITGYTDNGFTIGVQGIVNDNTDRFVAWCWKAGGPQVTNTDGTITSYVSASSESGVGIVTYTGNGTDGATVGHGLGAHADLIIVKNRSSDSTNWPVALFNANSEGGSWSHIILLNAAGTETDTPANGKIRSNTTNTTTFECVDGSSNANDVNTSGDNYVAYCFSEVPGFSRYTGFTGNGSTDGPFIWCGFRPALVVIKNLSTNGQEWVVYDNERQKFNAAIADNHWVYWNSPIAEDHGRGVSDQNRAPFDFLSNGVKIRAGSNPSNGSGSTYIFMAWAEAPTVNLYGGQANAR